MLIPERRCPFPNCPSHAQTKSLGIVRHGFMRRRTGARLRLLCRTCGRTFCNRRGTAYYRIQRPRSTFGPFTRLLAEGISCAAIGRLLDLSPGTVSSRLARAAHHARAFGDEHDRVSAPIEVQFDELCAHQAAERGSPWIFNGVEVWSRFWVAANVSSEAGARRAPSSTAPARFSPT